jgi:hypothetical protein
MLNFYQINKNNEIRTHDRLIFKNLIRTMSKNRFNLIA